MATGNAVNKNPVITGTANQITVVNAADNSTSAISTASTQLSTTQPMFSAILSATATNQTGDGTAYTVIFDTALNNQGTSYATGTGIFTAPATAVYLFTSSLLVANTNIVTSLEMDLTLNTGRWVFAYTSVSIGAGALQMFRGAAIVPLTSGDTAKIVLTASGALKTTSITGAANPNPDSYFCGYLLH